MKSLLWWSDDPAEGVWNMAADERLAAEAERLGRILVRVYGWTPAAISLGRFQAYGEAEAIVRSAGLPLVRRPSGGGAIVHGTDLTYAVSVPRGFSWAARPERLYEVVHGAMVDVLGDLGLTARMHRPGPSLQPMPGAVEAFHCFNRRAFGDLEVAVDPGGNGSDPAAGGSFTKVMGAAQRRLAGVVLQHGSLLLATPTLASGQAGHLGLEELIGQPVSVMALVDAWLQRLAASMRCDRTFVPGPSWAEDASGLEPAVARYRSAAWLHRR